MLAGLGVLGAVACWPRADLVVYCAHDLQLAEPLLQEFGARSGLRVQVVYDTEATKSLGLIERVIAERAAPRADVLWGNEPLGVFRLADLGLLEPYRGDGFARIPAAWRDPEGRWVGFAARLRVWFGAPAAVDLTDTSGWARLLAAAPGDLGDFAVAVPLYGTTRFHLTALCARWGIDVLRARFSRWRAAGLRLVRGNAVVRDLVVAGGARSGWTDTDDAFAAPPSFRTVPVTVDGQALCVPNVVAIVRGARHPAAARALVDFLLSAASELALARGAGAQVPLGPVDAAALPARVRDLRALLPTAMPLDALLPHHAAVLAWLREELTGQ